MIGGPASVYSTLDEGVKVKHDDKVVASYGNERDALSFAKGYNTGWRAAKNERPITNTEDRPLTISVHDEREHMTVEFSVTPRQMRMIHNALKSPENRVSQDMADRFLFNP